MRILDLFAGIGGFSLAAHEMGWGTAAFVEWEKYPQQVLSKNFPGVPIYGDIKQFHYEQEKERIGPVDLVCGGFPCQPFSSAGKRKGTNDDRYLWPEMLRVIREVGPTWVVGENVAGLLSMDGGAVFEEVCASLENEGYTVESFVLPAISLGAPHRRDRVWIVAQNTVSNGRQHSVRQKGNEIREQRKFNAGDRQRVFPATSSNSSPHASEIYVERCKNRQGEKQLRRGNQWTATSPHADQAGTQRQSWNGNGSHQPRRQQAEQNGHREQSTWSEHWLQAATRFCGMDDGLPDWMDSSERKTIYNAVGYFGREEVERRTGLDLQEVEWQVQRTARLKTLGNSIAWELAYEIFRAIDEINQTP